MDKEIIDGLVIILCVAFIFIGIGSYIYLFKALYKAFRERKTPDSSNLQILSSAKMLCEAGEYGSAIDRLSDGVLISAILIPRYCEDILRIYEKAGRLDEFVEQRCKSKSSEFYSAYGKALMRMNKNEVALKVFLKKSVLHLSEDDKVNIFELHIRLGNYDRANALFEMVKELKSLSEEDKLKILDLYLGSGNYNQAYAWLETLKETKSIRNNPKFYYDFARICEYKNQIELAGKIYQHFMDARINYRDIAERHKKMKDLVSVRPKPSVQVPAMAPSFSSGHMGLLDGKYEIRREIGAGGMGTVYEGWNHQLNQRVAIKKMRSELKAYHKERSRFIQEAKLVGRLSHPYIVGIHAIVEKDGEIYLVLDYVDGKPLSAILEEKKRLPLEECKNIFNYVCRAVDYAHKQKVIHRDLKPSNIMIDTNNFAKVMDFGLAREMEDSITKLTRQTVAGTPAYMAPEQYHGTVRPESDIYAMGVCFYEMLAGDVPFRGIDTQAEKEKGQFRELSLVLPWLSKGTRIDQFIKRALDPDPIERIESAMEFLTLLKNL